MPDNISFFRTKRDNDNDLNIADKYIQGRFKTLYLDYFTFEIIRIVILKTRNELNISNKEFEDILFQNLRKIPKIYFDDCKECGTKCLVNVMENDKINFESEFGIISKDIPSFMRRKVKANRFYYEFVSDVCSCIDEILNNKLQKDILDKFLNEVYVDILYFINDNCWSNCNNYCMSHAFQDSYKEFLDASYYGY